MGFNYQILKYKRYIRNEMNVNKKMILHIFKLTSPTLRQSKFSIVNNLNLILKHILIFYCKQGYYTHIAHYEYAYLMYYCYRKCTRKRLLGYLGFLYMYSNENNTLALTNSELYLYLHIILNESIYFYFVFHFRLRATLCI